MRRCHFTLIEILIVMSLLTVASSAIGIGGRKWLAHHRFACAADAVASRLNLAQQIALSRQTDVAVSFTLIDDHLEIVVTSDDPLPPGLARLVQRLKVQGIAELELNGKSPCQIAFSTTGATPSTRGELTLIPPRSNGRRYISFPGYPTHLIAKTKRCQLPSLTTGSYPEGNRA